MLTITRDQVQAYHRRYIAAMTDATCPLAERELHRSNLQYAIALFLVDQPHIVLADLMSPASLKRSNL